MSDLALDGYPVRDTLRPGAAEQTATLHAPTPAEARQQREKAMLDAAKPCPFCGATTLLVGSWEIDIGEVASIECATCCGGAPFSIWQMRDGRTDNGGAP